MAVIHVHAEIHRGRSNPIEQVHLRRNTELSLTGIDIQIDAACAELRGELYKRFGISPKNSDPVIFRTSDFEKEDSEDGLAFEENTPEEEQQAEAYMELVEDQNQKAHVRYLESELKTLLQEKVEHAEQLTELEQQLKLLEPLKQLVKELL